MRRLIVLVLLALTLTAQPALAWTNGSNNGDGYATHDWLLDHAINMAGTHGKWVQKQTALWASDDPDDLNFPGHNVNEHLFRETLGAHGAPSRISELYYEIIQALDAGDTTTASRDLGWLSHYFTDINQPFHSHGYPTTFRGVGSESWADGLHSEYELDVDQYTHQYNSSVYSITDAGRKPVTDVRLETINAALYSRSRCEKLANNLDNIGFWDSTVQTSTKEVLNRAANDLADIIASIDARQGEAAAPSKIITTVSKRYPANNQNISTTAKALDASGHPMEGIAVTFNWHLASGDEIETSYSGKDGVSTSWMKIGTNQLMKKYYVTWTCTVSGKTLTGTQWFMPTPVLGTLQNGIKTTVNTHRPKVGSYIKASTLCRDTSGRPVGGLTVWFAWRSPLGTVKRSAVTDRYGVARSSYLVRRGDRGHRIWVKGYTMSGGINRSSSASFTPY